MSIWKKLLRLALWLVGGAVALVVVAGDLSLLAVNWRDRPPSEAALKMSAVYRDRPQVRTPITRIESMRWVSVLAVAMIRTPRAFAASSGCAIS